MAKKLIVFLTGAVLLSAAWIGVVSSIESRQEAMKAQGAPIKLDLMQSRWQRLAGFKAIENDELKKPAKFIYTFSGEEMVLIDSIKSEEISSDLYLDIKTTALDAGKDSSFYIFEAPSGEQFLLRATNIGEELKITGFDLDLSLNFFGQGLEDTDWFVLDSKKRVLAAGERAYVGRSKAAGKSYDSFKYTLAGKGYEFLLLKEKEVNLAAAYFMGVIGIFFMMTGLFFYTGGESENMEASLGEGSFKDPVAAQVPNQALTLGLESDIIDEDIPEDVRMVDLSGTKEENLDYTDFLIENPILAKAPKESASPIEHIDPVAKPEVKVEAVTSDEWIKLAEELSANIDKFTESVENSKNEEGPSKADA